MANICVQAVAFLAFWCMVVYVTGVPFHHDQETRFLKKSKIDDLLKKDVTTTPHKIEEEFHKEIKNVVEAHRKRNGVVFDRIWKVNSIHQQKRTKIEKWKKSMIPDEQIIETNMGDKQQLFEGDIVTTPTTEQIILDAKNNPSYKRKRNTIDDLHYIWATREIPYVFDPSLSPEARDATLIAMAEVHKKTCVRWVSYTGGPTQEHYVNIKAENGCYSTLGRDVSQKGAQPLSVGKGCESPGVVLHELLHAMGFYHEQSRDDRGETIKIIWENIKPGYDDQFMKYSRGKIDKLGIDYDPESIMHYSPDAFSYGGLTTIEVIDPNKSIGNTLGTLTELDAVEINALYDCQIAGPCQDGSTSCKAWADAGQCDANPDWMKVNCKKSCDTCNACQDGFSGCGTWADNGECDKNPVWMEVNCKKSCNTCNVCQDSAADCRVLADQGDCTTNADWMNANCQRSCQACVSKWSSWGPCDENCGYKDRQRFCFSNDKTLCPNVNAYGIETETKQCASTECYVVDGHWGRWSNWGSCSVTCDLGTRQRTRQCDDPAPNKDGQNCPGHNVGSGECTGRRCNMGPYDTDFEDGWGIWSYGSDQDLQWKRNLGPAYTKYTGPPGDHTLQRKGHYVYIDSSSAALGQTATLFSSQLEFTSLKCLSFYYSMYGDQMGVLQLYIVPLNRPRVGKVIVSGNQGSGWHKAEITLDITGVFQFLFKATVGGVTSDIALDDIYIDNGACSAETTATVPTCLNDHKECIWWASTGMCKTNPVYILQTCQLSCGVCGPVPCQDYQEDCAQWASQGGCEVSPEYMLVHCKDSCGQC